MAVARAPGGLELAWSRLGTGLEPARPAHTGAASVLLAQLLEPPLNFVPSILFAFHSLHAALHRRHGTPRHTTARGHANRRKVYVFM